MLMRVNGVPLDTVAVLDRGFQYGDGVFTTLAVQDGIPLLLDAHRARLRRDAATLGIPWLDDAGLREDICALLSQQPDGILKIQLTRGQGGRGYRPPHPVLPTRVVSLYPPANYPPAYATEGVLVRYCDQRLGTQPTLAGLKHMNRLEQILARAEWSDGPEAEGLMLDQDGLVVEGTMTNLFMVRQGCLLTPRLDRCGVSGVMRETLWAGAQALGVEVREIRLSTADLAQAEEVFVCNSVIGLWPVRQLAGQHYAVGRVTRRMAEWLKLKLQAERDAGF